MQRHARPGRGRVGPARRARRRARRARLSGRAAPGRRDRRPRRATPAHPDVHVFHAGTVASTTAASSIARRPRAVRHGARRFGASTRSARLRGGRAAIRFDGHAVPPRHRPSRDRARDEAPSAARDRRVDRRLASTCSGLQARIVAAARGRRRGSSAFDRRSLSTSRAGGALEGGGGISRLLEDGDVFERGGVQLLARARRAPAAVGDAHRAGARRPRVARRWACRWSSIRAIRTCRPCT